MIGQNVLGMLYDGLLDFGIMIDEMTSQNVMANS